MLLNATEAFRQCVMFHYRRLSVKETREIYETYMKRDFPPVELKPFRQIERMAKLGLYDIFAFYEQEHLVGYALCARNENKDAVLLDYFAIATDMRGKGCGRKVMEMLWQIYQDMDILILESENPEFFEDEQDHERKLRRIRFYEERCRMTKCDFTTRLFGVEYVIMAKGCKAKADSALAAQKLKEIYQVLITPENYQRHLLIRR